MAGNAGAIRAGAAFVEIFTEQSKLRRGLMAASKRLKSWGASVSGFGRTLLVAGGAVLAPLLGAVKQFAAMGDTLDKMSARTGTSVEFLSKLGHAAQIGGTDLQTMENGIKRLQKTAYDASRGLSTASDAFSDLGVSATDSNGELKNTEQLFMESVAALSEMENETKKAALAQALFGRAGTQLLPMLKGGKEGLAAVMKEAEELGLVMSTEDATAAAELTDAGTRLWAVLKQITFSVGGALAPALKQLADWFTKIVRPVIDWVKQNRGLVVTIAAVAAGVVAAGAALIVLGGAITAAGVVLGALSTLLGVVGSVVGAIISPVGLLVAAIAGGAYAFFTFTDAGREMLAKVREIFGTLFAIAKDTFGGIFDALKAGDFALAGRVAFLGLKHAAYQGLLSIRGIIGDQLTGIAGLLLSGDLTGAWEQTVKALGSMWMSLWSGVTLILTDASKQIVSIWNKATSFIAAKIIDLGKMPGFAKAFELATGVNLIEQQQKAEQLNRQERVFLLKRIDTLKAEQAAATTDEDRARIAGDLAAAEKRLIDLADPVDFAADVKRGADELLNQQAESLKRTFDLINQHVAAQAAAANAEAKKGGDAALAKLAEDADRAFQEWREAIAAAREAREEAEKRAAKEAGDAGPGPGDDEDRERALSVAGTFNAFGARGLGTGGPMERMAAGIDKVEKHTRDIAYESRWGRGFGWS